MLFEKRLTFLFILNKRAPYTLGSCWLLQSKTLLDCSTVFLRFSTELYMKQASTVFELIDIQPVRSFEFLWSQSSLPIFYLHLIESKYVSPAGTSGARSVLRMLQQKCNVINRASLDWWRPNVEKTKKYLLYAAVRGLNTFRFLGNKDEALKASMLDMLRRDYKISLSPVGFVSLLVSHIVCFTRFEQQCMLSATSQLIVLISDQYSTGLSLFEEVSSPAIVVNSNIKR